MHVIAEARYYDGGLQIERLPKLAQPIIPNALSDLVGLRSSEVELAAGEFAIELVVWPDSVSTLSWIACYTRGYDCQFGDRGVACGVGVWLAGATIKHSLPLIRFLESAAIDLGQTGRISDGARRNLVELIERFSERGWASHPSNRAPSENLQNYSCDIRSEYFNLGGSSDNCFELASLDALGQFLLVPHDTRPIRRVYFLTRKSQINVSGTQQFSFNNALSYAEHLIHSLGTYAVKSASAQHDKWISLSSRKAS